jgi:hypothetical protein
VSTPRKPRVFRPESASTAWLRWKWIKRIGNRSSESSPKIHLGGLSGPGEGNEGQVKYHTSLLDAFQANPASAWIPAGASCRKKSDYGITLVVIA